MLDQSQLEAFLGRPLTSTEAANLDSYLEIAEKRLSNLLCFSLKSGTETRVYDTRDGYRTAYVDPFTEVTQVKVGDTVYTDGWIKKHDDAYQDDWYNVVEFDKRLHGERIEVTATWGFTTLPADLGALLAGLFGIYETEKARKVQRKKLEDFEVVFKDVSSEFEQFVIDNADTISSYAQCEKAIRHGFVEPVYYY